MKEEAQVELLKVAAQIVGDMDRKGSTMLSDLQYKAKAANTDKEASDYEVLIVYVFQRLKVLIAADSQ